MPIYVHGCHTCGKKVETLYGISDVSLPLDQLIVKHEDIKELLTKHKKNCKLQGQPMGRLVTSANLNGFVGGVSVGEKAVLGEKQKERKLRSKKHFKKEVLPTLQNGADKQHFTKKLKDI